MVADGGLGWIPWALRQGERSRETSGAPEQHDRSRTEQRPRRLIVCAACGHEVTDESARIEMAGRHQHTCVNPAGYVYRIGCFRVAPGCVGTGSWSGEYSWFAGYVWQVACCGSCSIHLGWAFEPEQVDQGDERFFGLIADRLHELPKA